MNKIKFTIIIAALFIATAFTSFAQVSSNAPTWYNQLFTTIKSSGVLQATNYAFEPYVTYAPGIKASDKIGAGFLSVYNVNQYVGAGIGVDYLGQFSLVSGNATLKLPISVGQYIPFNFASNLVVTPFVLGGLGTPLGGANTSVAVIADTGVYLSFGKLWGGKFNVGACYGEWANVGDYSGTRYHGFLGWSKGF